MSEAATEAAAALPTTEAAGRNIIDDVISATKQTTPERTQELVKVLLEQALSGVVTFDKNMSQTFEKAIVELDRRLSMQLREIMHDERVLKAEGTWRGLHHLVLNGQSGQEIKIRVMNATKRELNRDLSRVSEFDQSQLFKKIYENEFGTPGGEPFGALIGDYEWSNRPDDIETLRLISNVSAAAFAPFISGTAPGMFGFSNWSELSKPRDLGRLFETSEYILWRGFRDTEDSRFVSLVMPRVLARVPYGTATKPIDEFDYEETEMDPRGGSLPLEHNEYCWMNAAYVMAVRFADSFAQGGFCTAIRGAEGGGRVDGLPTHVFTTDDGDRDAMCPTEIGITDRREAELSNLGFLPLCHYRNTDYAVFFGGQSVQRPKKYDRHEATANAAISARLPCVMATSRFAHYLKVMARDKIGSSLDAGEVSMWLNRWLMNYVTPTSTPSAADKIRFPLKEAKVDVKEVPGRPGAFQAVAYLLPWLPMEELTTSLRMVARIPGGGG